MIESLFTVRTRPVVRMRNKEKAALAGRQKAGPAAGRRGGVPFMKTPPRGVRSHGLRPVCHLGYNTGIMVLGIVIGAGRGMRISRAAGRFPRARVKET